MNRFENALFTFPVTRKHFFSDKVYSLYLFSDEILMTDNINKPAKYSVKLNLTTTITWIIIDTKISALQIPYNNGVKAFYGSPNKLSLLREMIGGRVFYSNINDFYEMQMKVGQGMAGEVYRAWNVSQKEYVAVKKCEKLKLAEHEGGIPQFIQELQLLQSLEHKNILKLKECHADLQNYYIVTEFIEGRSLHTELISRNTGLPINQAISITLQILNALIYIHSQGIMHRDINPRNIMITETVKLIDFGFARKVKHTLTFPISGTPGYMAPEIVNYLKGKQYDERADIFSLGCTLYKMQQLLYGRLTGENVFHKQKNIFQENKEGTFELRKCRSHPEFNSTKMDQLFVLLPYMLENDPNDRLTAKFCKEILLEIDGNNINIEKLIRKQQIMKSFLISTEETPLDKTPQSFNSKKGKSSEHLIKIEENEMVKKRQTRLLKNV